MSSERERGTSDTVEERSLCSEAYDVSRGGAQRSENVGMSNKNPGENPGHRKLKVS